MSRGAIIIYITRPEDLATIVNPQELDLAVVKVDAKTGVTEPADKEKHRAVFQYFQGNWIVIDNTKATFTTDTLVPNVSKIKRSHIEELRNFTNFIMNYYASRYGDVYFHTHNYSKASLWWSLDGAEVMQGNFAKITFDDYDVAGMYKKWLTVNFGAIADTTNEDINSRVRFSYKDSTQIDHNVLDIMTLALRSYVAANFEKEVNIFGALTVASNASFIKDVTIFGALDVADATIEKTLTVGGKLTAATNVEIGGNLNVINGTVETDDLTVHGISKLTGTLDVGGKVTLFDLTTTGNVLSKQIVAGHLLVENDPTIGSVANIQSDGNILAVGTMTAGEVDGLNKVTSSNIHLRTASSLLTAGETEKTVLRTNESDPLNFKIVVNPNDEYKQVDVNAAKFTQNGSPVWTGANDGPDSGLDADKLDGKEGKFYEDLAGAGTAHALLGFTADGALVHGKHEGHHIEDGTGINADRLDGLHKDDILALIPSKLYVYQYLFDTGATPNPPTSSSHYNSGYANYPIWFNMGTQTSNFASFNWPYATIDFTNIIAEKGIANPVIIPMISKQGSSSLLWALSNVAYYVEGTKLMLNGNVLKVTAATGFAHVYGAYVTLGVSTWYLTVLVADALSLESIQFEPTEVAGWTTVTSGI